MFYTPAAGDHGLPHDPFKAIIAPRPIGWISSMDGQGRVNLAPYSFFNAFSTRPPIVGFSSEGAKDSVSFVRETGEFVCNLVTFDLREAMNATSAPLPRGENEFAHAGLEAEPSRLVRPPRVKGVPAALECRLTEIVTMKTAAGNALDSFLVLGEVVGVHIDDRYLRDGRFDTAAARPIARCGYADYAVVTELFSIARPPGG
ncbi:MAG: flavin reductase family protein [Burkholderiales bacterium]|jgi:flavin reductase (DIM6/NTAB) family NADH-FMN oxidoreductase RutF|nr:flavin reductase family protein [Burkholderiales bacterium]